MASFMNPIDGLFPDIDKILKFMIIKNQIEADKYETNESRRTSAMYINAVLFQDSFLMYHPFYTIEMFQQAALAIGISPFKYNDIIRWLNNIYSVPEIYSRDGKSNLKEEMRKRGREKLINEYVELNDYYRKLAGLPPINTQSHEFIYLPITLQLTFNVGPDVPIHELSDTIQNKLIITKEYELMLQQNPDKEYLKFIGVYKIPLVVSRRARDFELIRYVPNERSDINPYLLRLFGTLYNEYRDYVMTVLYNKEFVDLVVGYREYMQLIIICLVLMQVSPRTIESCLDHRFFDDRIIQIVFEMYSIPKDAVISKSVRRRLVVMLNKMIQRKATNQVFYDILDVLGYEDTKISKFLFVKQQKYTDDEHHTAIFEENTRMIITETFDMYNQPTGTIHMNNGNTITYEDWLNDTIDPNILITEEFKTKSIKANWRLPKDPNKTWLPKYINEWKNPENIQLDINVVVLEDETHMDGNNYQAYTYTLKDIQYPNLEKELAEYNLPLYDTFGNLNTPPGYEEKLNRGGELIWSDGQPRYIPVTDVYFQAIDMKEYDQYSAIKEGYNSYDYNTITSGDPRWWEMDDVKELVRGKNYTIADSKYIMVDSVIDQTQMLFETVFFMRMILDNKISTDEFLFTIPEIEEFGSSLVSLFDAMLFILAAMCEEQNLTGEIITSASGILACAGFNFDLDMDEFRRYINSTQYIDKERILSFLSNISMKNISDINRIFNELMIPLRDWLTIEMSRSDNVEKFLEYEKVYRAIFCYDAMREVFTDNFDKPEDIIMETYDIPKTDYYAYKAFYPHWPDKTTTNIAGDVSSGYFPFLGQTQELLKQYTFIIPGYNEPIHIYDILNSPDLRYKIDPISGDKIKNPMFWDNEDGEVNEAIYGPLGLLTQIDSMDSNMLSNAFFKVNTSTDDGQFIVEDTPIPFSIKTKFKQILHNKVEMDYWGWAEPPKTYKDYLRRKNKLFFDLFQKHKHNHDEFLNDLMAVVKAIEEEIEFRLKYFDRFVGGDALFYEPLILLIKYFKSYMVDFARSATSFIIKDKFDAGGNCNMIKLFDAPGAMNIHLVGGMHEKSFGFYDTTSKIHHDIIPTDILKMTDFVKFKINGIEEDKWYTGEPDTGMFVKDNFS